MKRNLIYILMSVLTALLAVSCNEAVIDDMSPETGFLSVSVGRDDEVFTKEIVEPSADMAFRIEVYRGETLVAEVADHRTWTGTSPLEIPVGKYHVKAYYGDNKAGFDKPYYIGETDVTVTTGKTANADIVCTLANVMVSVDMDASIKNNFRSYSVFVTDGTEAGITFSNTAGTLSSVGYIPATGTLHWELVLENMSGEFYKASKTYTDVKPQQHYNLKFALSESDDDTGYAAIKLVVDDKLEELVYELVLDFSESELPSYSSNAGFELTNQMSVVVGDDSKKEINFTAPEGIRSMILALDAEVQTRAGNSLVYYELVEASQETINVLAAKGVRTESIPYGATSARIDITDYVKNLPTGDYNVDLTVYDSKGHVSNLPMDFTIISDVDADMVSISPWAEFAVVKGKYFSAKAPAGVTFMYKKVSDSSWQTVGSSDLVFDSAAKTFEAEIGGLDPNSSYVIKAVSAEDVDTREVEFRTETAEVIYNMSFDDWYQDGKIYYPYRKGANPAVWDCANPATANFTKSYTTQDSYVATADSKSSARMESEYVVIKFAAGNLFTGKFVDFSTKGAELDWGVPFTSRPVAMKGYYDYTSGLIDKVPKDGSLDHLKGQPDKCQILVFLTNWTEPFHIDTVAGQFVDFSENNKSIIAVGKLESSVTTNGYKEFVIPLEYRDLNTKPTYAVITCCSSYLGDYFAGSTSSLMYVDEFSFEYDVTKLTDEQKAKVNYK